MLLEIYSNQEEDYPKRGDIAAQSTPTSRLKDLYFQKLCKHEKLAPLNLKFLGWLPHYLSLSNVVVVDPTFPSVYLPCTITTVTRVTGVVLSCGGKIGFSIICIK